YGRSQRPSGSIRRIGGRSLETVSIGLTVTDRSWVLGWCWPEPALTAGCETGTFDLGTNAPGWATPRVGSGGRRWTGGVSAPTGRTNSSFVELMGARCAPIDRSQFCF